MATIKVKNSAGEWVESNFKSQFKMDWVPVSADKLSYDLSPYLLEGDEFILMFTYGSTTTAAPYVWYSGEGLARVVDADAIFLDNTTMKSRSPLEMVADTESNTSTISSYFNYDRANRIFTLTPPAGNTSAKLCNYAGLIYVG